MKKIIQIIIIAVATIILPVSCSDFLDMTPRDKKVVKTVEDHRDILASYMYLLKTTNRSQFGKIMGIETFTFPKFDVSRYLSLYTGESMPKINSPNLFNTETNEYTGEAVQILSWRVTDHYAWRQPYKFLGALNILIKEIKTAEGNDEDLRNYVLGEALVWRVFTYFKMLQYYAPYKNNDYGIPMYLDPSDNIGNAMPERWKQPDVYRQLLADCNETLALLEKTPTQEWNLAYRTDFVHAITAAIYTWKAMSGAAEASDWKNAGEHAEKAMQGRNLATSTETLKRMFDCSNAMLLQPFQHSEFYFRILDGTNGQILNFLYGYSGTPFGPFASGGANKEYAEMYSGNDRRKTFYFNADATLNDKYNFFSMSIYGGGGSLMPYRLAEMYLIAAEAAIRQGDAARGTQLLNEFRASRYDNPQPITGAAETVLQAVLMERKREFYLENDMIWLDMKRLGVRMEREINGQKHVLEPDDFRYTFPIPREEMEINRKMVQNPGWENINL